MHVFVALQRASRKIGSPTELPSLNKDFTYLLTYLFMSLYAVLSHMRCLGCDLGLNWVGF